MRNRLRIMVQSKTLVSNGFKKICLWQKGEDWKVTVEDRVDLTLEIDKYFESEKPLKKKERALKGFFEKIYKEFQEEEKEEAIINYHPEVKDHKGEYTMDIFTLCKIEIKDLINASLEELNNYDWKKVAQMN